MSLKKKIIGIMPPLVQNIAYSCYTSIATSPLMKSGYVVMLELSSFCNARCNFCVNPHLKRKKGIMSDEIFVKSIERIKTEKIPVKRILLHMNGEPLTDPKLIERVDKLKALFPKASIGFTSNFELADDDLIKDLIEHKLDEITISINSIDPVEYNRIMGLNYEKTSQNIDYLIKQNNLNSSHKIHIILSVVAKEKDEILLEAIKARYGGDTEIRVMRLGNWGRTGNKEAGEARHTGACGSLIHHVHILSNGDYALCCFDAEGIVGKNVMECSIKEAVTTGIVKEMRNEQFLRGIVSPVCRGCSFAK